MFSRLFSRLFSRKPKPSAQRTPIVTGVVTREPSVVAFSSRQAARRDDISDPLHPLNQITVSPVYFDATTIGDDIKHKVFGGYEVDTGHHHHHSSSHDSCSYDSGSYDSGSSSSSCD